MFLVLIVLGSIFYVLVVRVLCKIFGSLKFCIS